MKQIISSVFSDIYTIGSIIFCIFRFTKYNCKGIKASACRSFMKYVKKLRSFNLHTLQIRIAD